MFYASEHPDEVVGLVFVDSADKQQNQRFGTLFKNDDENDARARTRAISLMRFGIPRLLGWCAEVYAGDLPKIRPILPTLTALSCRKIAFETTTHEWEGFRNSDAEVSNLGPVPLAVLSHDPERWSSPAYVAQGQVIWDQMQEELSHLSPNSYRVVAKGSDHYIQVERPDLVLQAVRRVYDSVLHNTPIVRPGGLVQ